MVEKGVQDCPLLAAAHNYMGHSVMGSDGCLKNLVGNWLEGVVRKRFLRSLNTRVLVFTVSYLQHSYLFQNESPSQVDCYFWSSFEATNLETICQDYYYSRNVPLPRT